PAPWTIPWRPAHALPRLRPSDPMTRITRSAWCRPAGRTGRTSLVRAPRLWEPTPADCWLPSDAPRGGSALLGGVDGARQAPPERVPAGPPVRPHATSRGGTSAGQLHSQ